MPVYESVHWAVCLTMMGWPVIANDAHCSVCVWIAEKVPYRNLYHSCSGSYSPYTWSVIWPKIRLDPCGIVGLVPW